jgi:hypothetical protein
MKIGNKFYIILAVSTLFLATIACGTTSNTGEKVGEVNQATVPAESPKSTDVPISAEVASSPTPSKTVFTVGDVITLEDQNIVLNSIAFTNGVLKANFTIDNPGSSDVNVSSMMSFSAKSDDGTVLEQDIFDCGTSMDGRVLPGDKLRGDICYKLPAAGLFKLYYTSDLLSSNPVVWSFDTNNLPKAVEQPVSQSVDTTNTYNVGDVIKINNSTVTLNSADIKNNLLKANFTITNGGSENVNVSSMMSFSAKAPDGTILEQEYFDCGTSLDGTIIPGDKLKGDICWKTGGLSPIKIYFVDDLWSSGATVWSIK